MQPVNPDDIPPPAPPVEPAPLPELDDDEDDLGTAPIALCDIEEQRVPRERTGFTQLDDMLGGGIVKGSVTIFGAMPGSGKCLGRGTLVMKSDGSVIPVERVAIGDFLMGPDGKPRSVLSTTCGVGPLFHIQPIKGETWICNDVHVMTLVHSLTNKVFDIGLDRLLSEPKHGSMRHYSKLFSVPIDRFDGFDHVLPVDPYFLGVWFGDGTKELRYMRQYESDVLATVSITKPDFEIRELCETTAKQWGLGVTVVDSHRCPRFLIAGAKGADNPLLSAMRSVLGPDLRMPDRYVRAPRQQRLEFLAGLLDSDGDLDNNCFSITQKREDWARDVWWMARSLGFCSTISSTIKGCRLSDGSYFKGAYWRVSISGDVDQIPTRIRRKQAGPRQQKKVATRTGFNATAIGDGEFFGFTLSGDGRFLLGDFTVTHNSTFTLQVADRMALPTLYVTGEETVAMVGDRAHRIDAISKRVAVCAETDLRRILKQTLRSKAEFLIIDSIQTLTHPSIQGNARSPSQVAGCAKILFDFAKLHGVSVWVICHVTGDGGLAGTMTLQHFGDVLLFMDNVNVIRRVVRCLGKNRFGSVAAVAHLEMTDQGLSECKPLEPDFEARSDSPFDDGSSN